MPEAVTTGVTQERSPAHSLPQGCLADAGLTDKTTLARKVNHPKPGAAASLGEGAKV